MVQDQLYSGDHYYEPIEELARATPLWSLHTQAGATLLWSLHTQFLELIIMIINYAMLTKTYAHSSRSRSPTETPYYNWSRSTTEPLHYSQSRSAMEPPHSSRSNSSTEPPYYNWSRLITEPLHYNQGRSPTEPPHLSWSRSLMALHYNWSRHTTTGAAPYGASPLKLEPLPFGASLQLEPPTNGVSPYQTSLSQVLTVISKEDRTADYF